MNIQCHPITKVSWSTLCLFCLTLLLNACQLLNISSARVALGENVFYQLQAVPSEFNGLISLQKLTVTREDETHQLLVQTELQNQQINMVGFSQSGLQLFQLSWQQGGALELSTNIMLPDIPAEQLLAYYQLSNWPVAKVKKGLQGIQLKNNDKNNSREFLIGQQLIFTVQQNNQQSLMIHYRDKYQITVENID
ncbi:DUF3261 domain-containing protein [Paraglaciecola sp. L3A3]|uniref:DUF3261 domain-containing protein n=1 Tax=Paraglaciecola sp. L3A3 TaxID=2686358 RepID=UPI00131C0A99|nr:DUF3261 domain-containing protein [Paraglaciecola sp. L3A3]